MRSLGHLLLLFSFSCFVFYRFLRKNRYFLCEYTHPFEKKSLSIAFIAVPFLAYLSSLFTLSLVLTLWAYLCQFFRVECLFKSDWGQILLVFLEKLLALLLIVFLLRRYFSPVWSSLWSWRHGKKAPHHLLVLFTDILKGMRDYLVSFPFVFLALSFSFFLSQLFPDQGLDQLAVAYMKKAFSHHILIFFAILSTVVLAPLLEELLFRGCLQFYLRSRFTRPLAIFLVSFLFTLLHLSPSQGVRKNVELTFPLFTLSVFLGFSYEKNASLICPIVLHGIFNGLQVIHLYYNL